ncbi:hypothetical protein [Calothrix sp. UHCC 0171]|uniref:hypothetical protein n=1 Tax=Calothrix sp. UHCC 0171 TaxID=3110245 RepID=UPI002B205902|nr:hypothetical protein [Calothrix sp. UHCC 0171]MEA5574790.1 hypothetical protein [Calothrix sp. UHCC 0171]
MSDQYTEKQLQNYENAKSEAAKDDALYRLGTHLEVLPCNGNAQLTPEQRDTVLDAARKGDSNA